MLNEETAISSERFLVFKLGSSLFAMPLLSAKEVIAPRKLLSIPNSSQILRGIINLRGTIFTMIDLGAKLGIKLKKSSEDNTGNSFIILDNHEYSFGIMVDSVETVLSIPASQIEKVESTININHGIHVNQLAKVDNQLIMILNIENLIKDLAHNKSTT